MVANAVWVFASCSCDFEFTVTPYPSTANTGKTVSGFDNNSLFKGMAYEPRER